MKKHSASIFADRKNSSFQLTSHTRFQKFTIKNSNKINRMKKKETMHNLISLEKLNVLLFKIQVKKHKNGRREDLVICGSGNLKTTSSRAKIIFVFDLKIIFKFENNIFACYFK